jgi:hypothetical protein
VFADLRPVMNSNADVVLPGSAPAVYQACAKKWARSWVNLAPSGLPT